MEMAQQQDTSAQNTPGKRLSPSQARVLAAIAAGTYQPTVMDGRTLRVLQRGGLVQKQEGWPPTYTTTELALAALAKSGSAA